MLTNIFVFIFGASLGSFLNVVVGRLHSGEPIVNSRSRCPHCRKILGWRELLPLVSFLIQNRKCRKCRKKISWQYWLMEAGTGVVLVLGWLALRDLKVVDWVWYGTMIMWLYFIAVLIIVFMYDLKYFLIPDIIIFPAAVVTLVWNLILFFFHGQQVLGYLASAVLPAAFFLSLIIFSRGRWMGMGDVKLVFLLGLFLGIPKTLLMLFLAFTLGSLVGLGLILFRRYNLRSPIPFGTFLNFASLITLLYGDTIINWYLKAMYFSAW